MAQPGGKRPGAGRPKGAANKKTRATVAKIEASGQTPLEYMLSVMRNEELSVAERMDAAHKAAPYVHSKLASVEHTSPDGSLKPQVVQLMAVTPDADAGDSD